VVEGTVIIGGMNSGIGTINSGLLARKSRYVASIWFSNSVATTVDVGVDVAPMMVSVGWNPFPGMTGP
jgi:hypothetical protein